MLRLAKQISRQFVCLPARVWFLLPKWLQVGALVFMLRREATGLNRGCPILALEDASDLTPSCPCALSGKEVPGCGKAGPL